MTSYIETIVKTRYCESDALGHINNVSYYIYIEQARVDFFRETGIVTDMQFFPFILVSSKCDYKNQLYIDEHLMIHTRVSQIGNSSITLAHEMKREDDNLLIALGTSVCAFFDFEKQKSKKLNDEIIDKLAEFKTSSL